MVTDAEFWDKVAQKYARSTIKDMGGYEKTVARTRELLQPTDQVLELGCGTGTTALKLCDRAHSYLGSDISPQMITIAREKLATEPQARLTFAVETADRLATRGDSYDAVLGFNYLHLVSDLDATLRDIFRLTRRGGLFISKTPCLRDMNPLIPLLIRPAQWLGKAPSVLVFSARELQQSIEKAGFIIEASERHASKGKDVRPFFVARKPV